MKRPERLADYLEHIAEAIERIADLTHAFENAAELEGDQKTQAAVIRYIEIPELKQQIEALLKR